MHSRKATTYMLIYYLFAYMYIGYFDYRPIVRYITNYAPHTFPWL